METIILIVVTIIAASFIIWLSVRSVDMSGQDEIDEMLHK